MEETEVKHTVNGGMKKEETREDRTGASGPPDLATVRSTNSVASLLTRGEEERGVKRKREEVQEDVSMLNGYHRFQVKLRVNTKSECKSQSGKPGLIVECVDGKKNTVQLCMYGMRVGEWNTQLEEGRIYAISHLLCKYQKQTNGMEQVILYADEGKTTVTECLQEMQDPQRQVSGTVSEVLRALADQEKPMIAVTGYLAVVDASQASPEGNHAAAIWVEIFDTTLTAINVEIPPAIWHDLERREELTMGRRVTLSHCFSRQLGRAISLQMARTGSVVIEKDEANTTLYPPWSLSLVSDRQLLPTFEGSQQLAWVRKFKSMKDILIRFTDVLLGFNPRETVFYLACSNLKGDKRMCRKRVELGELNADSHFCVACNTYVKPQPIYQIRLQVLKERKQPTGTVMMEEICTATAWEEVAQDLLGKSVEELQQEMTREKELSGDSHVPSIMNYIKQCLDRVELCELVVRYSREKFERINIKSFTKKETRYVSRGLPLERGS